MKRFRLFFAQCSFHQCFQAEHFEFIGFSTHNFFNIYHPHDLKLLTTIRLSLSHIRGNKFEHKISDCLDKIGTCGKNIKP